MDEPDSGLVGASETGGKKQFTRVLVFKALNSEL